jgi:hypothetical protein
MRYHMTNGGAATSIPVAMGASRAELDATFDASIVRNLNRRAVAVRVRRRERSDRTISPAVG